MYTLNQWLSRVFGRRVHTIDNHYAKHEHPSSRNVNGVSIASQAEKQFAFLSLTFELFCHLLTFSKINFFKKFFGVTNSLDPDQA